MTSTALSKRYPIWIDRFQQEVTKVQLAMEKTRKAETLYNIVRDALLIADLKWDLKVDIYHENISITGAISVADTAGDILPLCDLIHEGMQRLGLRTKDAERPDLTPSSYSAGVTWLCYAKEQTIADMGYILIRLDIPPTLGCRDYKTTKTITTVEETRIHTELRNPPEITRSVDDAEIPF